MKRGEVIAVRTSIGTSFNVTFEKAGSCRGCGAPMLWTRTARGKRLPLNSEPNEASLYASHFSTCKTPSMFRGAP